MQNVFEENNIIEPSFEMDHAPADILSFIEMLDQTDKELCQKIFVDGEDIKKVAARFGFSKNDLLRHLRMVLAPLAEDFDISVTFEDHEKSDGPDRPPKGSKRYSRTRKTGFSPREVVGK